MSNLFRGVHNVKIGEEMTDRRLAALHRSAPTKQLTDRPPSGDSHTADTLQATSRTTGSPPRCSMTPAQITARHNSQLWVTIEAKIDT
jgi:hypothetical protein